MQPFRAVLTALAIALVLVITPAPGPASAAPAPVVAPVRVVPAAPQATPRPKGTVSPTATPGTSAPHTPSAARQAAEEEGRRWVQIAVLVGGGLIGAVIFFFGMGWLLRRRPRR